MKNLTDVETLGATSAINTDKTGTLTLNQMMVSTLYTDGAWFTVEGEGYARPARSGRWPARRCPDFTRLAYGLVLDSDATVSDDGARHRRPDGGGAGGAGRQAGRRRRGDPAGLPAAGRGAVRLRVQVHGDLPPASQVDGADYVVELVKGGPDVVLARCSAGRRPAQRARRCRSSRSAAGSRRPTGSMGEKGLRVLAFAARLVADDELPLVHADPMALDHGSRLRRHGRHHRPAASVGEGGRGDRAARPASTSG